jgi:hypothetical protein
MTLVSQIVELLESEGFGNAAKFLRNVHYKECDPQLMELLMANDLSLSAKIMLIADSVAPNAPEPNMGDGLPSGMQNNLQDLAYGQWKANQRIRKQMQQIAMQLDCK